MDDYHPISGKTYSLFGEGSGTEGFYTCIAELADEVLKHTGWTEERLLEFLQSASENRKKLRKAALKKPVDLKNTARMEIPDTPALAYILNRGREVLSQYMRDVELHTRSVGPYRRLRDPTLLSSREQYYLYMLEFELVNRVHLEKFRQARFKIALLPYCLKERQDDCKAMPDETDYRCKHCVKTCYINRVSSLLEDMDINPYILSRGKVEKLLAGLYAKHGSIGVLGIACVVELVWGMRLCMKAGVPVVGIPLNANRCPRWMGTMHETSIDIVAIGRLLSDVTNGSPGTLPGILPVPVIPA